jgi:ferritin-like metal-binding protein YciE
MAEMNERDAKLVQYLGEALAKERELETALQLHIAMTTKAPYKKRLQQHLRETKSHARQVEQRIKKLGGGSTVQVAQKTVTTAVGKGRAALKGQIDAVRGATPLGPAEQESMLKNARQEYMEEAAEIATYRTIEAFAEKVGDRETARLAKSIRREEERMAKFLERQIATLTNAVATAEVPAAQRNGGRSRRRSPSTSRRRSGASGSRSSSRSSSRAKTKPKSGSRTGSRRRSGSGTRARSRARS